MVNAIPGQNLPVLNFAYRLPKPWTYRFTPGWMGGGGGTSLLEANRDVPLDGVAF